MATEIDPNEEVVLYSRLMELPKEECLEELENLSEKTELLVSVITKVRWELEKEKKGEA